MFQVHPVSIFARQIAVYQSRRYSVQVPDDSPLVQLSSFQPDYLVIGERHVVSIELFNSEDEEVGKSHGFWCLRQKSICLTRSEPNIFDDSAALDYP